MANSLTATKAALDLVAEAVKDTTNLLGSGDKADSWLAYGNLIPKLMAFVPQANQLGSEFKSLNSSDAVTLVDGAVTTLGLPEGKAKDVVDTSLSIFDEIMTHVKDRVEHLAKVIHEKTEGDKPGAGGQ